MILPIKTKIQQVIVCVNSSTSFVSGILPIKTKIQQVSTSFVCEFVDFANYDQNLTSDSLCEYIFYL